MISRMAIGTAQFGQNYGVANKSGIVSPYQIHQIFSIARKYGVDTIDTAISYGESEISLGRIGVDGYRIITKLPEFSGGESIRQWMRSELLASKQRLNTRSIYGVLLHRPQQLNGPLGDDLIRELEYLKKDGLISKIGVSIYSPEDLGDHLLKKFDIVQAPYNILDQRLITSGLAGKLKEFGVEIHIRSIFLQGLLLMTKRDRPLKYQKWNNIWLKWDAWLDEHEISPIQACINFGLFRNEIDRVIIGVDSALQFSEIMELSVQKRIAQWPNFKNIDINLINPARWTDL